MALMQHSHKKKNNSHSLIFLTLLVCSIIMTAGMSQISGEEPPLDMRFRKIIGTSISNKMEGKFSITASGGDNITSLSLLFNGTQVASSPNNSLSFTFDTSDYGVGMMNITLIGEDSLGAFSQITEMKDFLSSAVGTWITVIVLVIAIPITIYRLFQRYRAKKLVNVSTEDKKQRIKIDIDKDF
jgi:hypothetical protein